MLQLNVFGCLMFKIEDMLKDMLLNLLNFVYLCFLGIFFDNFDTLFFASLSEAYAKRAKDL